MELPEFMIRVKLPNPAGFAPCPSGDTDYQEAYNKALQEAIPEGFEEIKERTAVSRPKDSEGYTYVRLKCANEDLVLAKMRKELEESRKVVGQLRKLLADHVLKRY